MCGVLFAFGPLPSETPKIWYKQITYFLIERLVNFILSTIQLFCEE